MQYRIDVPFYIDLPELPASTDPAVAEWHARNALDALFGRHRVGHDSIRVPYGTIERDQDLASLDVQPWNPEG
jgi:hypothetical protein